MHSTSDEADFDICWFPPAAEANLCGHATLASAFVLFNQLGWDRDEIRFASASGVLAARRGSSGMITMDFPVREALRIPLPEGLEAAIGSRVGTRPEGRLLIPARPAGPIFSRARCWASVPSRSAPH